MPNLWTPAPPNAHQPADIASHLTSRSQSTRPATRRLVNRRRPLLDQLETRQLLSATAVPATVELNVQLQPSSISLATVKSLATTAGATAQPTSVPGLFEIQAPASTAASLERALAASPAVLYAVPAQTIQSATIPNDPYYAVAQTGLNGTWGINAPAAWAKTTGSTAVTVADIDTGINFNHPDLASNVWLNQAEIPSTIRPSLTDVNKDSLITFTDLNNPVNQGSGKIVDTNSDGVITGADVIAPVSAGGWSSGSTQDGATAYPDDLIGWNFVASTNSPLDDNGHGTATAGIIGAVGNNATGIAGVDWTTQIMALKALDSTGAGSDVEAAEAIDYAVSHGAKVINASWGLTGFDPTIAAAIQFADSQGVIIVAAAGNNSSNDTTSAYSPASYSAQFPNVISVAATDSTGALASFSNFGVGTVQLAAPGVNVISTLLGSYGFMSGTSMSAPFVSGTVALVESTHPTWTMTQVVDAVLDHTKPDPALTGKVTTGGILSAAAAVANTDGAYVTAATANGSATPLTTVQVTFNEDINPATFTSQQIALTGPAGPISGLSISQIPGPTDHAYLISFPAQTAAGSYSLTLAPTIQDLYGNKMDQNRNGVNGQTTDAFTTTFAVTSAGTGAQLVSTQSASTAARSNGTRAPALASNSPSQGAATPAGASTSTSTSTQIQIGSLDFISAALALPNQPKRTI